MKPYSFGSGQRRYEDEKRRGSTREEIDVTARFLIEVPHEEATVACARAVEVFLRSGSHFLSHADWGCKDGEHKAWMVVEVDNKDEALRIVPPAFRPQTKIVQLNAFTMKDIEDILRHHGP
jgi:hypothetical protein